MISLISFGPRSTLGFFLTPMSQANGWGRDTFAFAIAIQNLLWGVGQPFAGAVADRFGTVRVLCAGGAPLRDRSVLMAYSTTPGMLDLSAGVLIGFGLAGCSFSIVLAAFGKLVPEELAGVCVRRRHRRGLVRPVPLFAARGRADRTRSAGRPRW